MKSSRECSDSAAESVPTLADANTLEQPRPLSGDRSRCFIERLPPGSYCGNPQDYSDTGLPLRDDFPTTMGEDMALAGDCPKMAGTKACRGAERSRTASLRRGPSSYRRVKARSGDRFRSARGFARRPAIATILDAQTCEPPALPALTLAALKPAIEVATGALKNRGTRGLGMVLLQRAATARRRTAGRARRRASSRGSANRATATSGRCSRGRSGCGGAATYRPASRGPEPSRSCRP